MSGDLWRRLVTSGGVWSPPEVSCVWSPLEVSGVLSSLEVSGHLCWCLVSSGVVWCLVTPKVFKMSLNSNNPPFIRRGEPFCNFERKAMKETNYQ